MKRTYIITLTVYLLFLLDLILDWRVFPRSIPLIIYSGIFGVILVYLIISTIYQVLNSTKSYREKCITFCLGLVLLILGCIIGLIYFLFSPRLIAYCENNPVYASFVQPLECHPSQRVEVYTRNVPFGQNQSTDKFFMDCEGRSRIRNQEYVDSQCTLFGR